MDQFSPIPEYQRRNFKQGTPDSGFQARQSKNVFLKKRTQIPSGYGKEDFVFKLESNLLKEQRVNRVHRVEEREREKITQDHRPLDLRIPIKDHEFNPDKYQLSKRSRLQDDQGIRPQLARLNGLASTQKQSKLDDLGGYEAPPDNIKNYQLHRPIGSGGFAEVYQATSTSGVLKGRHVAIKIISRDKLKKEAAQLRVRREVEIHWQLDHPAIVELYSYFEDRASVYLVMRLCPHGNLLQYIKARKEGRLPEPEVRHVLSKLVSALQYLHGFGVIHRDIKCSNILIGEDLQIKLADFGLATRIDGISGDPKTLCGTINYISPEIIHRQPYSYNSDVWSLGCVVVALLTGKPPFEGHAGPNLSDRIKQANFELPGYVSAHAADLIENMLQKHPSSRITLSQILTHPFYHPSLPILPLDPRYFPSPGMMAPPPSPPLPVPEPTRAQLPVPRPKPRAISPKHINTSKIKKPLVSSTGSKLNYPPPEPPLPPLSQESLQTPVFTTQHLAPFHRETSRATLDLLPSGWLVLHFSQEKYLSVFSHDGSEVRFYYRPSQGQVTDSFLATARVLKSYLTLHLPEKYHRRYRYASQFLHNIRAESPKVLYRSAHAKCRLMLNLPYPDFDMRFDDGLIIYSQPLHSKLEFIYQDGSKSEVDTSNKTQLSLPKELHHPFLHFQECLGKCLLLSRKIDQAGEPIPLPYKFDARLRNPPSSDFLEYRHPHSQPDDRVATWVLQDNNSIMEDKAQLHPFDARYLENVGWCHRREGGGEYTLLFNDGVRLDLFSDSSLVTYFDSASSQTSPIELRLNDPLPSSVKAHLAYFNQFMMLWA